MGVLTAIGLAGLYTETYDVIRGAIAIIDPETGRVRRTLQLDALPEDVLISPP